MLIQLYKSAAMDLDCFLPCSFKVKTRGELKTRIHCTNHLKGVSPKKKGRIAASKRKTSSVPF